MKDINDTELTTVSIYIVSFINIEQFFMPNGPAAKMVGVPNSPGGRIVQGPKSSPWCRIVQGPNSAPWCRIVQGPNNSDAE